MLTLGDLVDAGLSPKMVCRGCGRSTEGGIVGLVQRHGRNYPMARYFGRLRCSQCGAPPDIVLVWNDNGAAARFTGVSLAYWQMKIGP